MVGYAWIVSRPHNRGTGHANPPYKLYSSFTGGSASAASTMAVARLKS